VSIRNRSSRFIKPFATAIMTLVSACTPHTKRPEAKIVTLSWWPEYCDMNRNDRYCQSSGFRGFVLQSVRDDPETLCPAADPEPLAINPGWLSFMADEAFVNEQWRKHGVCSASVPTTYFGSLERIYTDVHIPERFIRPNDNFSATVGDVKQRFATANHLNASDIGVFCEADLLAAVTIRKPLGPEGHSPPLPSTCPKGTFWVTAYMPPVE
jgi:ribonuclease T2